MLRIPELTMVSEDMSNERNAAVAGILRFLKALEIGRYKARDIEKCAAYLGM